MALSRERIAHRTARAVGVARSAADAGADARTRHLAAGAAGIWARAACRCWRAPSPPKPAAGLPRDWRRRLAALLPAETADPVTGRLRLSNADRARVALAAVPHHGEPLLPLAWAIGAEAVVDRLLIAGDAGSGRRTGAAWQRPKLPASGRDLIARGVVPGPEVARRLGAFERAWVAAGFPAMRTRWRGCSMWRRNNSLPVDAMASPTAAGRATWRQPSGVGVRSAFEADTPTPGRARARLSPSPQGGGIRGYPSSSAIMSAMASAKSTLNSCTTAAADFTLSTSPTPWPTK